MPKRVQVSLAAVIVVAGASRIRDGAQLRAREYVGRARHADLQGHIRLERGGVWCCFVG